MLYCVVGDEQGAVMQAGSRPGRFVISDLPVVMILVGSKRIDAMEYLLNEVKIINYSIKHIVCVCACACVCVFYAQQGCIYLIKK